MNKRCVFGFVLLVTLLTAALPVLAATPQVSVINNVLAESIVINGSKNVRINKPIVGFKVGTTADFQSLTTFLIRDPGVYAVRLEIFGPDNKMRAYYGPDMVEAKADNWTQNHLTSWRNVNFNVAGIYHFTVRVNNQLIADFPVSAN